MFIAPPLHGNYILKAVLKNLYDIHGDRFNLANPCTIYQLNVPILFPKN